MAKKKGLARHRSRRRKRNATAMVANPPIGKDFTEFILPAFGAYAGTRILSRIVFSIVQKRWPRFGKHAGALATVAGFTAAWFGAQRVKRLAPYQDAVVAGAGVAMMGTLFRTYVPKYGWIVADPTQADYARQAPPPLPEPTGPTEQSDYENLEAEAEAMVDQAIGPLPELREPRGAARNYPVQHVGTPAVQQVGNEEEDDFSDIINDGAVGSLAGGMSGGWAN